MTEHIDFPYPDNRFFLDEAGVHRGESINGYHEEVIASIGHIDPSTDKTYSLESPEIITVLNGSISVTIEDRSTVLFQRGDVFVLPLEKNISLATGSDQSFSYVCFYPKSQGELAKIGPFIQEDLGGVVKDSRVFTQDLKSLGSPTVSAQ